MGACTGLAPRGPAPRGPAGVSWKLTMSAASFFMWSWVTEVWWSISCSRWAMLSLSVITSSRRAEMVGPGREEDPRTSAVDCGPGSAWEGTCGGGTWNSSLAPPACPAPASAAPMPPASPPRPATSACGCPCACAWACACACAWTAWTCAWACAWACCVCVCDFAAVGTTRLNSESRCMQPRIKLGCENSTALGLPVLLAFFGHRVKL
mmetsp:Transcript_3127/g.10306  ORF Transcript_3127/g.10306 Transcript_3127/m.10306 type:complete len:208 (+) Transcript_3127:932-1555(+)